MGESVYVGGGSTQYRGSRGGTMEHTVLQYSWRRGAWSTLPECPVRWFGLTQFTGRLTTVGGINKTGSRTGRVYQFVSESQRWQESLPPMPTARYGVTVVSHPSSSLKTPAIAVCGGFAKVGVVNTVEVYSHSTSQWHTAEPLPTPLYLLTSARVGDIAYLLGGLGADVSSSKCCYSVSLDSLFTTATSPGASQSQHGSLWTAVSDTQCTCSSAVSFGGSLVAIGGVDSSTLSASADVHVLASRGSWERVRRGDMPEPRVLSTAVCLPSGELMVVGGKKGLSEAACTLFVASITN